METEIIKIDGKDVKIITSLPKEEMNDLLLTENDIENTLDLNKVNEELKEMEDKADE